MCPFSATLACYQIMYNHLDHRLDLCKIYVFKWAYYKNIGQYDIHFCIFFRLVPCLHPDLFFAFDVRSALRYC